MVIKDEASGIGGGQSQSLFSRAVPSPQIAVETTHPRNAPAQNTVDTSESTCHINVAPITWIVDVHTSLQVDSSCISSFP